MHNCGERWNSDVHLMIFLVGGVIMDIVGRVQDVVRISDDELSTVSFVGSMTKSS